ncbi:460_t:CDS:2, partial [Cetraspora pellucida]
MSKEAKHIDTLLQKVAYRASTILCPIDNLLRNTYESRPENDDDESMTAWQESLDEALKVISSNYKPKADHSEVFGECLHEFIGKENATNKLIHKALLHKKRDQQTIPANATQLYGKLHKGWLSEPRKSPTTTATTITEKVPYLGLEIGGYLRYCAHSWLRLFGASWVTSVISEEYTSIWSTSPPISIQHMSKRYFKLTKFSSLCSEIQSLLDKK